MTSAVSIVDFLLGESEEDFSAFVTTATSPYIESWATPYRKHGQAKDYYWYTRLETREGYVVDAGVEFFMHAGSPSVFQVHPVCYEGGVRIEQGSGLPYSKIDRKVTGQTIDIHAYSNETERVIRSMARAKTVVERDLHQIPQLNPEAILKTIYQVFDAHMHGALAREGVRESEEDFSAFTDAAVGPMLGAWAEPGDDGDYVWSNPANLNGREILDFELHILLYDKVENLNRHTVYLSCRFEGSNRSWFGFTYETEEAKSYIFTALYNATAEMKPKLSKPVIWKKGTALMTAAGDRLDYMQDVIVKHVKTPEGRRLGIIYFKGNPSNEC